MKEELFKNINSKLKSYKTVPKNISKFREGNTGQILKISFSQKSITGAQKNSFRVSFFGPVLNLDLQELLLE